MMKNVKYMRYVGFEKLIFFYFFLNVQENYTTQSQRKENIITQTVRDITNDAKQPYFTLGNRNISTYSRLYVCTCTLIMHH